MAWRGKRNYTVIVGDHRSVRMYRRMELGFPECSVVAAVSSSSPVSIFMIFVPLVYAMYGHNSVVHLKWIQQRRHRTNPRRVTAIVVLRTVQEYRSVVLEHLVAMVTGMIWSSADDSLCGCQKGFVCFYLMYLPLAQTVWSGTSVVAKEWVDRDVEGGDGGLMWGIVSAFASRDWGRQIKTEDSWAAG
jgi:hypothetical protein